MRSLRVGSMALLSLVGACTRAPAPVAVNKAVPEVSLATLYPLETGWKWAYSVEADGKNRVLATYAVVERSGGVAVVQAGEARITYQVTPEGVMRSGELGISDFVLKLPLTVGNSWSIAGGEAKVVAVDREVSVEAGRFPGCITVEETRHSPHRVTRTTFAPGAGPIEIEMLVDEGAGLVPSARASLLGVTRPGEDPTADGT